MMEKPETSPLQWQQTFPTQDGYWWFWDGHSPPQLAYVEGNGFVYCQESPSPYAECERCGHALREGIDAFPGYCAGPLHPPSRKKPV